MCKRHVSRGSVEPGLTNLNSDLKLQGYANKQTLRLLTKFHHPLINTWQAAFPCIHASSRSPQCSDALSERTILQMPWAQRVTTTVLRLNATYIYSVGKGRLAACNPLQRRVHTQLICSSAHASALSRNQHCCVSRPRHKSYSRPTPVCRVSVDAPELAVSGPSSMTQETVADDLSTSSSSGSLGELAANTAYRVVNFYHLVDIPNPFQACLSVCCLAWC